MAKEWAASFPLGQSPLLEPEDGESIDLVEGYYTLEASERFVSREAIRRHRLPTALWYHLLTHHRRALTGKTSPRPDTPFGARRQILSLGLTSSKVGLDALLGGYYSNAFACVRHMCECWGASRYLECYPDKSAGLFVPEYGVEAERFPKPKSLFAKLSRCNHSRAPKATVNHMRESWEEMCKGAHLSGEGIVQTASNEAGTAHLGATYEPALALTGFSHGLFVGYYLVREALWLLRGEQEDANIGNSLRLELDAVTRQLKQQSEEISADSYDKFAR